MSRLEGLDEIEPGLVDHVVGLIKRLYHPLSTKNDIDSAQKDLQQCQSSPSGWGLANELLGHEDQTVRFFGALTYTVKINQEGASLDESDALHLLKQLLSWLLRLTNQGEGALVIQKLCSTLTTFFVSPSSSWRLCVRHLIRCFETGRVSHEESLDESSDLSSSFLALSVKQLEVVLVFITTLAEDVSRIDHSSQHFSKLRKHIEDNIADVCKVLHVILQVPESRERCRALVCYQAWLSYARQQISDTSDQLQYLRGLIIPAMECLIPDDTSEIAAEIFTDMFINADSILTKEITHQFGSAVLESPWAFANMVDFRTHEVDEDVSRFGRLVLAFGQHICNTLVTSPQESQPVLNIMHEITQSQNFETVDQALSNAIVDFWEEYTMQDQSAVIDGGSSLKHELVKRQWIQAVEELCIASRLPTQGCDFQPLSGDSPLSDFRYRVRDVVQSSYDEFGISVLQKLVTMARQAHVQARSSGLAGVSSASALMNINGIPSLAEALSTLEAVFNCLGGLADFVQYNLHEQPQDEEDVTLEQLFNSEMFSDLTDLNLGIPMKLRKLAVTVMGENVKFLGRNTQSLLHAIDILLRCLSLQGIMESAARAISELCDGNRTTLVPRLQLFFDVSAEFLKYPESQQESRMYISGALASIVQAVPPGKQQGRATENLLSLIEQSYRFSTGGLEDDQETNVFNTLGLLARIGRSFQTPDDTPIDLDNDDSASSGYWSQEPGLIIQAQIINFLQTLIGPFRTSGAVLEAVCDVLKTGYRETTPGPFVFPYSVTVDIITTTPPSNSRLDMAISTAAAFISSHNTAPSSNLLSQAVLHLLTHITLIITHLSVPTTDPEAAHACVDFLTRIIPMHTALLTSLPAETIQSAFTFTLLCLAGPDILPKRAAASLWTSVLPPSSSSSSSSFSSAPPPSPEQFTSELITFFGPQLTSILTHSIAGRASRSDLDMLTEPLRRLIGSRPADAKQWIEQALGDPAFPSARVDEQAKRRFAAQVLGLRGAVKTKSVCMEFWGRCKGVGVGYG